MHRVDLAQTTSQSPDPVENNISIRLYHDERNEEWVGFNLAASAVEPIRPILYAQWCLQAAVTRFPCHSRSDCGPQGRTLPEAATEEAALAPGYPDVSRPATAGSCTDSRPYSLIPSETRFHT